jgi:GT2 family glycosyltransferase
VDKFPSRERAAATALEPRVTAIVVARNVRAGPSGQSPLDLCLQSAQAEPWIDDLVIVDHGNSDSVSSGLRSLHLDRRDVTVVRADPALSAAAAANLGALQARGRWLLFLDPDVVLQRGAVARLAAAGGGAHTPWIVGGRLTDSEGRERRAARRGALNTWSAIPVALGVGSVAPRRRKDVLAATPVAAVSGAFMLIPRDDFHKLNGFDPDFMSDFADLDLCRRAAAAGGSVLFQPDASGVQFSGATRRSGKQAQGLAMFAVKSARTPIEKAFAVIAGPAIATLIALRDFVAGRPPQRRR